MGYERKTVDFYVVQGNYGFGHGFEDVYASEDYKDARERLKEYRQNEPNAIHKLVVKREPKERVS